MKKILQFVSRFFINTTLLVLSFFTQWESPDIEKVEAQRFVFIGLFLFAVVCVSALLFTLFLLLV